MVESSCKASEDRPNLEPENTGRIQGRFRKGKSGNPRGKPKGARHQATRLAEAMLEDEAGVLMRQAIDRAMQGDSIALRLCIERLLQLVEAARSATCRDDLTAVAQIVSRLRLDGYVPEMLVFEALVLGKELAPPPPKPVSTTSFVGWKQLKNREVEPQLTRECGRPGGEARQQASRPPEMAARHFEWQGDQTEVDALANVRAPDSAA